MDGVTVPYRKSDRPLTLVRHQEVTHRIYQTALASARCSMVRRCETASIHILCAFVSFLRWVVEIKVSSNSTVSSEGLLQKNDLMILHPKLAPITAVAGQQLDPLGI